MSHDPANDEGQLREELVAYLDGELDAEQSRRIEQCAAVEPEARRMLEEFDRTWHMLDELDAPATSEDFTPHDLGDGRRGRCRGCAEAKAQGPRRRLRAGLWAAAGLVGAAAAGFLLVTALVPDPNAQLLQDLPILENYDSTARSTASIFSCAVNKEKLFTEDADALAGLPRRWRPWNERSPSGAGGWKRCRPNNSRYLLHSEQQFRAFRPKTSSGCETPRSDRERSRPGETPGNDEPLLQVVRDAAALSAGSSGQEMTLEERIKAVKEFVAKQAVRARTSTLDDRSRRVLAAWLDRYTAEHAGRFIENLVRHPGISQLPPKRQQAVLRQSLRRWQTAVRRTTADRGARDGPSPRRPLAGTARKAGSEEARRAGSNHRRVAPQTASHELDEELAIFSRARDRR